MKNYFLKMTLMIFIFAALFITGCNQAEKTNPDRDDNTPVIEGNDSGTKDNNSKDKITPKLADYFPLTLGSTWQYLGEGIEYASFTREVIFAAKNRGQIKEDNGGTISASVFETTDTDL